MEQMATDRQYATKRGFDFVIPEGEGVPFLVQSQPAVEKWCPQCGRWCLPFEGEVCGQHENNS